MRRGTRIVLVALLGGALHPRVARALDPSQPLADLAVQPFGETAGLPQPMVTALAQTPDGYLWLGTDGGLVRFDGVTFTVFDTGNAPLMSVNQVRALAVEAAGRLWIGCHGGPGLLSLSGGRFDLADARMNLGGESVRHLAVGAGGGLWIGSSHAITYAGPSGVQAFTAPTGMPDGGSRALAVDVPSGVLVGLEKGFGRVRDGRFVDLSAEAGLQGTAVVAIARDAAGAIWLGTAGGLVRLRAGEVRRFTTREGLPDAHVTALLVDRDGSLLAGTSHGFARVRGDRVEAAPPAAPLGRAAITALFEDRDGMVWVGTRTAGLLRVTERRISSIGVEQGLPSGVTSGVFQARDGALWIAMPGRGVARHHDGETRGYTTRDGLCTDFVRAMAEDRQGRLWFGGQQGPSTNLCRLEGQSFRDVRGLGDQIVRALLLDRAGTVWVGGRDLQRVDGDRLFTELPLGDVVYSLHEDRAGGLWVGAGKALHHRPAAGAPWQRHGARDGLPSALVYAIHEDDAGTLWFGTWHGLGRRRDGAFSGYRAADGLFDDPVYEVLEDAAGALWLSSPRGLFRVRKEAIQARDRDGTPVAATRFGVSDGMRTGCCEGGEGDTSGVRSRAGLLYLPTADGVAVVDPQRLAVPQAPPRVVIERVVMDGRSIAADAPPSPPGRGELRIDYTAPALGAPEKVRFRYRLEPLDQTWVDAGARRSASYANLPPGRYRFRAMAGNGDGQWDEGAVFALALAPHVHQTLWFRALAVTALAMLAFALHRWRLARIQARHAIILGERTRIARDLHDTLAQGFTTVAWRVDAALKQLTDGPPAVIESLHRARDQVRESLAEARHAVWDLRAGALDRGDLVAALREQIGTGAAFSVHGQPRPLPAPHENALLRITQEALTNALRYAQARTVTVDLTFADDGVRLAVTDDGVGFDATGDVAREGHFGLVGMRERVEPLGGTLEVASRPGAGTRIIAHLPRPSGERS